MSLYRGEPWLIGLSVIARLTTFHRLRDAARRQFPDGMLRERTLEHQQVYEYKVHLAKLALTEHTVPPDVSVRVTTYLLAFSTTFPTIFFKR